MGFFTDLKDDLSQAVNELLPEDELELEASAEKENQDAEDSGDGFEVNLSRMLDRVDEVQTQDLSEDTAAEEEEEPEEDVKEEAAAEPKEIPAAPAAHTPKAGSEISVLTESMLINGNVATEGELEVRGHVVGNVEALGKLNITGTIEGNSHAAEIYAENANVTGELRSQGSVKIGQSTVIIGNIYANSAVVAGAVKGDIDVKGPVILDASAIVMGDIKSKSVQINNGAVIEGMCSQCYADVNPTSFFDRFEKKK
ncbi:MAG: polymer-forming cytoskeletal protein [Clostridium sp.]|nr:polymer-forming cytoskeletal protein [Clostridium sp.]